MQGHIFAKSFSLSVEKINGEIFIYNRPENNQLSTMINEKLLETNHILL